MSRPEVIKVGPYDIRVADETDEDMAHDFYGTFSRLQLEIRMRPGQPRVCEVDTLIHELLHALFFVGDIRSKREETIVTRLATGLTQVLRDNPGFRTWLDDTLKGT
jgi:hypothetical protein